MKMKRITSLIYIFLLLIIYMLCLEKMQLKTEYLSSQPQQIYIYLYIYKSVLC